MSAVDPILFREAVDTDFQAVSRQISIAYRTAYQGLMKAEYLSSLTDDA